MDETLGAPTDVQVVLAKQLALWLLVTVVTLQGFVHVKRSRDLRWWSAGLGATAEATMLLGLPLAATVAGGWCAWQPSDLVRIAVLGVPGVVTGLLTVLDKAVRRTPTANVSEQ